MEWILLVICIKEVDLSAHGGFQLAVVRGVEPRHILALSRALDKKV